MNFYLFTRIKFETYKTFFRSMFNQIFSIKQLKMGISQPNQKELLDKIFKLSNIEDGEVGFVIQIVLFSIALSDRYRIFKKERESMQEELLEIQKGQSEKLEVLVKERTQEITQKQEEIMTQNEELHQ